MRFFINRPTVIEHTLGNGEFELFRQMAEPVRALASAIMTPQNVAHETEPLIAAAFYHRRSVYMAFPSDTANQAALSDAQPLAAPVSDPASLRSAADAIIAALDEAQTACLLPGLLAVRAGAHDSLQ